MNPPIRSQVEIDLILNRGNNAIADIGYALIGLGKRGLTLVDVEFRDMAYRLILLRAYLKNLVDVNGDFRLWYTSSTNEKIFNIMLNAVVQLSGAYSGPGVPLIRGKRIPLTIGVINNSTINVYNISGGGAVFSNLDVDSPNGVVDTIPITSIREFVYWIYKVRGSNSGEGSRSGTILATIRGSSVDWREDRAPDVDGITTPLTFTVAINGANLELIGVASTDNWIVQGNRLS